MPRTITVCAVQKPSMLTTVGDVCAQLLLTTTCILLYIAFANVLLFGSYALYLHTEACGEDCAVYQAASTSLMCVITVALLSLPSIF
jgi:hypothetical protein